MGDLSNARFAVAKESDREVSFVWQHQGVRVEKAYAFDDEGYGFTLTLSIANGTDRTLRPTFDVLWPIRAHEVGEFSEPGFAVLQDGDVDREKISAHGFFGRSGVKEPAEYSGEVEWAVLEDKYFVRALLPDRPRSARASYRPIEVAQSGTMTVGFEPVDLPAGQSVEHQFRGYAGPKRSADLDEVSPSLELSVNRGYSFIHPLTRFFEWALHACYSIVPNYGLAIILLTIMVRLVTAPIMSRQMKSMERMRAVQPMLKEIQEKYADDRQKQSEEMMALYKREGVNPLGGCLPMVLQFPVFIGLFYALQSSFDLRHAGFVFWINDLSAPESVFTLPGLDIPVRILPLIMGASMVLQQRLTPTTVDPAQARMMMTIMPIMFTVLFYQFPSGLVLYWLVSNLLGIAHQLWVGRKLRQ
jgi:YidC/Oxa1 family membrane protein insertase